MFLNFRLTLEDKTEILELGESRPDPEFLFRSATTDIYESTAAHRALHKYVPYLVLLSSSFRPVICFCASLFLFLSSLRLFLALSFVVLSPSSASHGQL